MAKQTAAEKRDHMARVTVTDEVWGEFRAASRVRGISVTTYLAQLVSREVMKLRADAAKADTLTARHAAAALAGARSLCDDLEGIIRRLEVLAQAEVPAADRTVELPRTADGVSESNDSSAYRREGGANPADIPPWEE